MNTVGYLKIGGIYLSLYEEGEMRRMRESTINKPYVVEIEWKEALPENNDIMRSSDNNKIINYYKDIQVCEIVVLYPPNSEYSRNKPQLRSTGNEYEPVRFENGQWIHEIRD